MEKEKNDKKKILFVFAIAVFLVLIVSATYAFFSVNTVSNFGTSTINATAGGIGSVTLNGDSAQLSMSLTRLDMAQGSSDITFYASTSGKTTTPTAVTLGTASVSPNTDTNTYHCTYTLSVTHSGTNDLYDKFNHQTNSTYDYTNRSAGQIILTINGVDYDFYNGWPANNRVTGEFNIKGNQTVDITAGLRFLNKSSINQNYLAGTDLNITINVVNGTLSCEVVEPPFKLIGTDSTTGLPVVRLTSIPSEEFYVISDAIDYSSLDSSFLAKINYDSSKSVLLAKYNLYVGQNCTSSSSCSQIDSSATGYGLQSVNAIGYANSYPSSAVVPFTGSSATYGYWYDTTTGTVKTQYGSSYNTSYIYDTNFVTAPNYSVAFRNNAGNANYSIAYYVKEYVERLGINGVGRLLTNTEASNLTQTQRTTGAYYWLGTAYNYAFVMSVRANGAIYRDYFYDNYDGIRPVIVVDTAYIDS